MACSSDKSPEDREHAHEIRRFVDEHWAAAQQP
jgi:hypothetical protein